MSFAGPRDPSLERALKEAHDKGIILIAAAGNAGPKSPPLYPAADRHVIAVTATDIDDRLFTGANRGNYLAIAAPGVDILVPAPARRIPDDDRNVGRHRAYQRRGRADAGAQSAAHAGRRPPHPDRRAPSGSGRPASSARLGRSGQGAGAGSAALGGGAGTCNDQADDHRSGGAAVRPRTVNRSCRVAGPACAAPAAS